MNTLPSDLNEQCALQCEGYVRAGVAPNGTVWLHPPGERNRSVPVPAYTENWHDCMRLVRRYHLTIYAGYDGQGEYWDVGIPDENTGVTLCRSDHEARLAIGEIALGIAQDAHEGATSPP